MNRIDCRITRVDFDERAIVGLWVLSGYKRGIRGFTELSYRVRAGADFTVDCGVVLLVAIEVGEEAVAYENFIDHVDGNFAWTGARGIAVD